MSIVLSLLYPFGTYTYVPVNRKASTDNEQYIHHKPLRLNLTVILNTSSCSRGMASRDQKLLAPNTCTGIRRPSDLSSFDLESVLLVHAAYPLVHFSEMRHFTIHFSDYRKAVLSAALRQRPTPISHPSLLPSRAH